MEVVEELVSRRGANVNAMEPKQSGIKQPWGWFTPLQLAILHGRVEGVRLLLELGMPLHRGSL